MLWLSGLADQRRARLATGVHHSPVLARRRTSDMAGALSCISISTVEAAIFSGACAC